MSQEKWSEEDVKTRTILPFLEKLGFHASDITCEQYVNVQFGRTMYRSDSGKSAEQATGFIDFVVSLPDEPNLILIEAKKDDSPITSEEIDQGLSYAKAVDPFPPVTMVTNGREWSIFDSRSRKEVSDEEIDGYKVGLQDAERYHMAIRRLRTLNANNLAAFSAWHTEEHMRPLLGSKSDKSKKYIPELFHPPSDLITHFDSFLSSDKLTFVLTGRAGDGKSCWMCHTALKLQRNGWRVFFFRGLDVRTGIAETIAREIQSQIGPQYSAIEALRRINEIADKAIVFVDGLDEISPTEAREITSKFLRDSATPRLRLVASCKSVSWPALKEVDQVPTVLGQHTAGEGLLCRLPLEWHWSDFDGIIRKHRDFFQCSARFGKRTLKEAQGSPFILRMLFEQAEGKTDSWVMSVDSTAIYDAVLSNARSRLKGVANFEEILTILAREMLNNNTATLPESEARAALGLRITEAIPEVFFRASILERDHLANDIPHIRFYFGRLRDFLIAFKVLRWQDIPPGELGEAISNHERSEVLRDALELFYTLGSDAVKRSLDGKIYQYGVDFLRAFSEQLHADFLPLKSRLVYQWQEGKKLGFVGEIILTPPRLRMEGIQAIDPGSPQIVLISTESDRKHDHQAGVMRGGGDVGIQPRRSASKTLWSGIKDLLEKFNLDESCCPILMKERVLAFHAAPYTSLIQNVPATVSKSRWQILFDKALRHKHHEFYNAKEKSGDCEVSWSGTTKSVSYGPTQRADERAMIDFATKAANSGKLIETEQFRMDTREEAIILNYLDLLESQGHANLTDEPLFRWYRKPFAERDRSGELEVVRWIGERLGLAYESFVRLNLPSHWESLPTVSNPKRIVLFPNRTSKGPNRWVFRSNEPRTRIEIVNNEDGLPARFPHPDLLTLGVQSNLLPTSYRSSRAGEKLNYQFFLFHMLIYDQLKADLKKAVPEFADLSHFGGNLTTWLS